MATINRWPTLAWLDGRYVNVIGGDRMEPDLHVDGVSVTAFKVDDDLFGEHVFPSLPDVFSKACLQAQKPTG